MLVSWHTRVKRQLLKTKKQKKKNEGALFIFIYQLVRKMKLIFES